MKNVDLEGSHMAGVNLRVATLKNANLQNCDLRGAVLAGADLEVTKHFALQTQNNIGLAWRNMSQRSNLFENLCL